MPRHVPPGMSRCSNPECSFVGTPEQFGFRKDGQPNPRCGMCRSAQASLGGRKFHSLPRRRSQSRDTKALRVVERWCGFSWKDWTTPEAKAWQARRKLLLEEVWTARMRRLAARAERCELAAIRQIVRAESERAA